MELKVCPYCGNNVFIAKTKRASLVIVNENNDTEIKEEGKEVKEIEIVACASCKKELAKESLILGSKCIKCNRIVSKEEVDENGVCLLCRIKEDTNELSKASKEDLISICKLLLEQEKQQQEQVTDVDKPKEKKPIKRKKKEPEQIVKQETNEDKEQIIKNVVVQEENHIDITENDSNKESLDIFEQAKEKVNENEDTTINEDKIEFPLYEENNEDFSAF